MALKPTLDSVEGLPAPVREHYTKADDGKYHLNLEGEHPKVAEFRQKNIDVLKENSTLKERYKDIDLAVVAAERAELTELRKGSPRITELETENARLKASTAAAEAKANETKLRAALTLQAQAAGVRAEALDIAVDKVITDYALEGDVVKAKAGLFSADRPGELRLPSESFQVLSREMGFLFKPSGGSGSGGSGSGTGDGVRILRDPTPQQLGQFASEIAKGRMRVEHSQ